MKALMLFFLAFVGFALIACSTSYQPAQEVVAITTVTVLPSATPTAAQIPTATIDYQSTAVIAQQTADEARRVNAMVTSQFEQRFHEQLQMTAEADRRVQEIYAWTVTAALTSIPLTETQQAIINTQIPQQQQLVSAQLTATKEGPTQIVAMIAAENQAKYGRINYLVGMFATGSIGVFAIGIVAFLFRLPMQAKPEPAHEALPQTETVIQLKQNHGGGTYSLERMVIPCSPEQLTELAEKITQGLKTLAINQWEGKDTLFTRTVIHQVRGWIRLNEFAVQTDDGQMAPTNDFLNFLMGWLDKQALPAEFEFAQVPAVVGQRQDTN